MSETLNTPGIYITEKNAFPSSVAAVDTALPIFIGYTEKTVYHGRSLTGQPTRISSIAEYQAFFGGDFHHTFGLQTDSQSPDGFFLTPPDKRFYLYSCLRLFYANGGQYAYILSLGNFERTHPDTDDADKNHVFDILLKTQEPTLLLMPDFVTDRDGCYDLYRRALEHCQVSCNRMAILDVIPAEEDSEPIAAIRAFRERLGNDGLSYGAAYYPWLHTSIVQENEVDFTNLRLHPEELKAILTEQNVSGIIDSRKAGAVEENAEENSKLHKALLAASPLYKKIMEKIRFELNLLPPSAAMAGIYTFIDLTRGVWKAPANVVISMALSPSVNISNVEQETMNIDPAGKSVNAIRSFIGEGVLVWGARTLDGNSLDWRYINVRRTVMMIERSVKLACRAFIFEPNDANTWVTLKSTIMNFLSGIWKQGGLAGATPEDAFIVHIGLGETMTPEDILEGILRVTLLVAVTRPAEFIEISFQQVQGR